MTTRFVRVTLAVAWRHLHNFLTNPSLLLPPLLLPIFLFAAFAGSLSALAHTPGFQYPDYGGFQFVFVLIQSAAFGGVFTGYSMAEDFESGFGRRMMLAAPNRTAIVAGYAVAALARTLFTSALVFGIAVVGGTEVRGGVADLLALLGLAVLANIAATLFTAGIALRYRTVQASPLMQVPMFMVLFLAPVFVPRRLLTGWLHDVAGLNPVTVVLEAGRGLFIGHPVRVPLAFGLISGIGVLLAIWALRGLRRAEAAADALR
ncbi:MAG: type transport system permease protein [Thermoleophilaceae bacterium]|jgi:ABC-2 type transport system permease protein|nr:type transport system permease protein [Thermoleophilaceae bacterium]